MKVHLEVGRSERYKSSLLDVHDYVTQDTPDAALSLFLHIEDQVDSLADPNFPRRMGRVSGTLELVVHPNYVVVLQQTATTVTVLNLMHVARQYP